MYGDGMTAPQKRIDTSSLKGLAHPLRAEMYGLLTSLGPATASSLAEHLGESTGATSYHLRQLARHGFIEEDPDRGSGRERWWRPMPGGSQLHAEDMAHSRAAIDTTIMVARQFADQRARQVDDFLRRAEHELGMDWVSASVQASTSVALTREETAAVSEAMTAALDDILSPYRGRDEVEGARMVAAHVNVFPLVGQVDR